MRLKPSARQRTIRRYVERHTGFKHDCDDIGCSKVKKQEKGCGMW